MDQTLSVAKVAKAEQKQVKTKGEGGEGGDAPVQSADRHTPQQQHAQHETETVQRGAKMGWNDQHTTGRGKTKSCVE